MELKENKKKEKEGEKEQAGEPQEAIILFSRLRPMLCVF